VKDKLELLAPVGSMEALYAAIENGANAVYLGGKLFNARQYASNFDLQELKEAVTYAHLRDVKVYVTVNILIDNSEMEEALDYIRYLYEIDIDGLIIQDIGLASLVRKSFPDFDLHGSTQMTVNNLEGADFLYKMGFTRVVLARETPIEEIRYIYENTPIELEAFIHGALCVSYSGQCLMSSLIGGRSGNRGRCAQPCRMPYSIVDSRGQLLKDWDRKYVLSTRDLNTLDEIEEIVNSGIVSLKIEGRMKRPEYVATVLSNYRKALDRGGHSIDRGDRQDMEQIFNRGFTKGLMFGDFGRNFISLDRPDNRGRVVGKVERADKYKVYIRLEDKLDKGDGLELELRGGEYKGIISPFSALKGSTISLEKPGYVEKDSIVYKSSSLELLNRAKESYRKSDIKKIVHMETRIKIGEKPKLRAWTNGKIIELEGEQVVEKGKNTALSREKIEEQLTKLGNTVYKLGDISISLDEAAYLPISAINQLRRSLVEALDRENKNFNHREAIDESNYQEGKKGFFTYGGKGKTSQRKISIRVSSLEQFEQLDLEKLDRLYLGFYESIDKAIHEIKNHNKEVFIWTDKILYKEDLERLSEIISPWEKDIDGISVSNLGSLEYFRKSFKTKLHGDIGLNVFNGHTLNYFRSIGLSSITLSPELNLRQINSIEDMTDVTTEAIVYGYLPLMITKHCPMALVKGCKDDSNCNTCKFARGYGLKDRMGASFYMDRREGFSSIYNSVPLMVVDSLDKIFKSGLSMGRLDFTIERDKVREIQSIYYDHAKGIIGSDEVGEFLGTYKEINNITNGHFFRGVI